MKISPALILFFLAPAIAELLSGSAPPAEFFNPISLLLLASLYGSGALVVREMKVRLSKGYVSMFVLGMAYGIVEEGLMVKSFFDPEWGDLGILSIYGRWQGVNWVWVEWLTIYHAIFSIAIPITIVELAYPERRNERWVGNKKFMGLVVLLGSVTAFGYLFLTDYRPPLPQYFFSAAIATLLMLVAWRIPANTGRNGRLQALMPRKLFLIGFLTTLTLFLLFMAGPHLINQPPVLIILGVGLLFAIFCFLKRYEWNEETLYHKFTLASSAVVFLAALTPLQELDKSRLDNTRGMLIVGIIALVLLALLRLRVKSQMFAREQELKEGNHRRLTRGASLFTISFTFLSETATRNQNNNLSIRFPELPKKLYAWGYPEQKLQTLARLSYSRCRGRGFLLSIDRPVTSLSMM